MLPTALRCLTSTLRSSRSTPLEVLCDPLQRRACQLRAPLQCSSSFQLPTGSSAIHAVSGGLHEDDQHDRSNRDLHPNQLRQYCQQPLARSDSVFTYEGPLKKAVGSLKKLSLFSCGVTIFTSPIILILDTSATPLGPKAGIAATLVAFGVFTTGLLHWFTSPYVRRLVFDRSSGIVELHTLSVFARPQTTRIHLSEIRYPDTLRPQVTFQARGKFFYLDADHFSDKQLLAALTPDEPSAAGPNDKDSR